MGPALPFIGAGLGIYSAIKGGQQQGRATKDYEQQLAQQEQIRNMVLGRITQGPQGAVGNPFSPAYGPIQAPEALASGSDGWMSGVPGMMAKGTPAPSLFDRLKKK